MHAAGIVHRDFKPQNILLSDDAHPFLADFGITKSRDVALTRSGAFVGSLLYSAPQQIEGAEITAACDIYALTGVLVHCLTGLPPYVRDGDEALASAHLEEPRPALAPAAKQLAPEFDGVIARGMARQPSDRYRTAADLMRAAEAALLALPPALRERSSPLQDRSERAPWEADPDGTEDRVDTVPDLNQIASVQAAAWVPVPATGQPRRGWCWQR